MMSENLNDVSKKDNLENDRTRLALTQFLLS